MIIAFTGNGKGKTTAAMGQAIRAFGQNKRVLIIQFIKGDWETGEEKFFKNFLSFTFRFLFLKCGKGFIKILGDKLPFSEHQKAAQNGLKFFEQAVKQKKWDLIILDEINMAVNLKLIKTNDVLKILKNIKADKCGISKYKSGFARKEIKADLRGKINMDIILTGRNAPKSFMKIADLVTEMKEIKHPFQKGEPAKKGIDY